MERSDRIETLARGCIVRHGGAAQARVVEAIGRAEAKGNWAMAGLWHRVRFRIMRIAMPNATPAPLADDQASASSARAAAQSAAI
jgi:hypothetical protein